MIRIKYSIRVFIKKDTGKVAVRVRWNSKQSEVTFITGLYAEEVKWDSDAQKAKKGTTHNVRKMTFTASEINSAIADFRQEIENCMDICSLKNVIPTPDELKKMVNEHLGRNEKEIETNVVKRKTLKTLFDEFIATRGRERNWTKLCIEKYTQAFNQYRAANPKATWASDVTQETMFNLRDWYVENRYRNRTANKQFVMLRSFLNWINDQVGYSLPRTVLHYRSNLKVLPKTVTYVTDDELQYFMDYDFKKNERLSHARDLFCFMCYTSLRYSDLSNLRPAHISNNRIVMHAHKTGKPLTIPLNDGALMILAKYEGQETQDAHVFEVPSSQKLNKAIQDAAKTAELDRKVLDEYYIGSEIVTEERFFYDIISCHVGRRSFVTNSFAKDMSAPSIMKCTGHSSYKTMQPYIDSESSSQTREMQKWNTNPYKQKIINYLNGANDEDLQRLLDFINKKDVI